MSPLPSLLPLSSLSSKYTTPSLTEMHPTTGWLLYQIPVQSGLVQCQEISRAEAVAFARALAIVIIVVKMHPPLPTRNESNHRLVVVSNSGPVRSCPMPRNWSRSSSIRARSGPVLSVRSCPMPRNIKSRSSSSSSSRSSSGSTQGPDRTYGPVRSCPIPQNIKSRSSSSSRSSSGSIRSGLVQ